MSASPQGPESPAPLALPPWFESLCRKADRIGFGDKLRIGYRGNRGFRLLCDDNPQSPAWADALVQLGAAMDRDGAGEFGHGYYQRIVQRLLKPSAAPARAAPEVEYYVPPEPASATPARSRHAQPHGKAP